MQKFTLTCQLPLKLLTFVVLALGKICVLSLSWIKVCVPKYYTYKSYVIIVNVFPPKAAS